METKLKKPFDKNAYNPYLFTSYKVVKKTLKYSFYVMLLYFAWEGFMSWE